MIRDGIVSFGSCMGAVSTLASYGHTGSHPVCSCLLDGMGMALAHSDTGVDHVVSSWVDGRMDRCESCVACCCGMA